jgi:hypothetical protein
MDDDLAKRAVACAGWRWMPGMLTVTGYRLVRPQHGMWRITQHAPENHLDCVDVADHNFVPDLSDPATMGCLLALVREAWPNACTMHVSTGWAVWTDGWAVWTDPRLGIGPTEAEALVAALEAAEGREVNDG